MARAPRLLQLLDLLRRHRRPVSGAVLAETLGVSLRTLYRDIAALQAQGVPIDGAVGLGYRLQAGYVLPPLMFDEEEIEALVLGSRWVGQLPDTRLAAAARAALAKIAAVLPPERMHALQHNHLLIGPVEPNAGGQDGRHLAELRAAIRHQAKLRLDYRDAGDRPSRRVIWPFALGYFERVQVVVAWCELRDAIRHFRIDRIVVLHPVGERFRVSRRALLRDWCAAEGVSLDDLDAEAAPEAAADRI